MIKFMKLEISECIEVDTKILIEEYGQLLTESSKTVSYTHLDVYKRQNLTQ